MLVAIAIAVALVGWRVFALDAPASSDDAFIAFRYAQNLADGHGIVFNVGDHVWGYTSPLHVLVLGAVGALGVDIPSAAVVLGLVATGWSAWLVYRLAARVVEPRLAVAVGVVVLGSHVTFQYLALETPLVGAMLWSFVALACGGRRVATGLVGALACLARPDAALLVVPILVATPALRHWRAIAAFVVPGVAWVAFSASYYGDVLPNSLRAKFGGAPRLDYVKWIAGQFARWGTEPVERTNWEPAPLALNLAVLAIAVAAAVVVARTPRVRALRPLCLALVGYPLAMLVSYIVMRPAIGHDWEYWNALAFELAAVALALAIVLPPRAIHQIGAVAVALVFVLGLRGKLAVIGASNDAYWDGARYRAYTAVAGYLRAIAPGASLFSGEPGILGFATEAPVFDGFLISHRPTTAPEFLLLQGKVPTADSFGAHYVLARDFPAAGFIELSLLRVAR